MQSVRIIAVIVLLASLKSGFASLNGTFTRPHFHGKLFYQVSNKSSSSLVGCALDCLRFGWCFTFVFQNGAHDAVNCYFLNAPLIGPSLSSDYVTYIRDTDEKGSNHKVLSAFYKLPGGSSVRMQGCESTVYAPEYSFIKFDYPEGRIYTVASGKFRVKPGSNHDGYKIYERYRENGVVKKYLCADVMGAPDSNDEYFFTCDHPMAGHTLNFKPNTPMSNTEGICGITVYGFKVVQDQFMNGKK
ncbi:Uncharacterised protein at_DN0027 [Pycnogonum litorale]